jgi:hypothetical protein
MGIRSVWPFAVGALLCAAEASAQWVPRWIGVWQHPEAAHSARAAGIRVDADGSVFALVNTMHHALAHATLVRFGREGDFAWLREVQAEPLGIEAFDGGGIAVASATQVDEYARSSGERLRHCEWSGVVSGVDERYETRPLAQSPQGDVLFAAAVGEGSSGGDFVVLRCDRHGNILPAWHWPFAGYRAVTGIVAFADGGAAITGAGRPGERTPGAYYTVRFDADGRVVFVDSEPGDLGSPDGPVRMLADAEGSLLLVAVPENFAGNLGAMAWKILPDGQRAWTLRIPDAPGSMGTLRAEGFAVTPEGDALVAVTTTESNLRVLRLAGADGRVVWRTELPVHLSVTGFALAANGRILVSGVDYNNDGPSTVMYTRLVELGPDGQLLRTQDDPDLPFISRAASGCAGWYVLSSGPYDAASGNDAVVKQYDAGFDDTCTPEAPIFADGFDAAVR